MGVKRQENEQAGGRVLSAVPSRVVRKSKCFQILSDIIQVFFIGHKLYSMKTNILYLIAGLLLGLITGCSSDIGHLEDWTEEPENQEHSMKLVFQANLKEFDGSSASTRTGENWAWKDSAVVYIQYHVGTEVVRGHAVYNKSSDSWEAYWQGAIGKSDKCEVFFFESAPTDDKHSVSLAPTQAIYADTAATYLISNAKMSIQANLSPLTSRIRFVGESGQNIFVKGLSYYTGYDADNNQLTYSADTIFAEVGNDGYTPYYYCLFTDTTQRQMSIEYYKDGYKFLFSRIFDSFVLKTGESGYLTIPTEDNPKEWSVRRLLEFTIAGNGSTGSFRMIQVEAGSFLMGSEEPNAPSYVRPVHEVTLSHDYFMGETEVTQDLWYAVMGLSPTSAGGQWSVNYGLGAEYPAYYISYEDCQDFLAKLNKLTGQLFRLPTEAEWEYAAKGGLLSNGYIYAGSNEWTDVAWETDPSNYVNHIVGQKEPNELGLFDMTGNVLEFCNDYYGHYPSSSEVDPTGPTTSKLGHVVRGGECWERSYDGRGKNIYTGLRLAL